MKICIPILENRGLLSPMSPQLGAAPSLLLVDMGTLAYRAVPNAAGGGARPAGTDEALDAHGVDAFIVAALDRGAVAELAQRRASVYEARAGRVADALADLIAGRLPVLHRRPAERAGR